jgi:uncharacterized protein with FMN-binding domain
MKKYLQITIVLGIFALLVFVRQMKGNNQPVVVGNQTNNNPLPSQSNPTTTQTPQSSNSNSTVPTSTVTPPPQQQGQYKNGSYTGSVQDAFYGNIQVRAVISGGKIADVIFLQFPNDNRTSQYVNSIADPMLKQEAIAVQSAQVDIVSGASASSQAFQASLADALTLAK